MLTLALDLPLPVTPNPSASQYYFLKSRYEIQIKEIKRSSQYQVRDAAEM
jgi:hypothetical protein